MESASDSQAIHGLPTFDLSPGSSLPAWDAHEPEPELGISAQPCEWPASRGLLLPPPLEIPRFGAGTVNQRAVMATLAIAGGDASGPRTKQIPLLCSVCPESPRFSDVSHLLTHIASKGHLHHETQTKLKSHQDISASVSLQQYEQWYKENGIEALLVDRMKAKQLKEAVRNKRSRGVSAAPPLKQARRKTKRILASSLVKTEHDDFSQDFSMFPGFLPFETGLEIQDEFFGTNDMMALKGQVWPGMGKMDLANEDMKRTRNQRKPKSVIEKMKKTSEGIEPTQVVMTPEFEVERVKGVYDDSSPLMGHEDALPQKKVAKPKRKRSEPLAEISVNIPRGGNRRLARGNHAHGKTSKTKMGFNHAVSSNIIPAQGQYRHSHDVFRDIDGGHDANENRLLSASSLREQRFDLRSRLTMHPLNPMAHSNLVSPTPSSRDIPERTYSRGMNRGRLQGQSYGGLNSHLSFSSFHHPETSYAMNDASIYNNSARHSFAPVGQMNLTHQDHFRLSSNNHIHTKLEDFAHSGSGESLPSSTTSDFMISSGPNPLFSQERMFLNNFNQGPTGHPINLLGFTPINRSREHTHTSCHDQDQQSGTSNVKLEVQLCELSDDTKVEASKNSGFNMSSIWEPSIAENGVDIHEDLRNEALDL